MMQENRHTKPALGIGYTAIYAVSTVDGVY